MRAVALLLVAGCTTTTTVSVKGEELYRRIDELRTTGRADVPTTKSEGDDRGGEPGLETVTLDTKLTHDHRTRSLLAFTDGCVNRDAAGNAIVQLDGCYLGIYGRDRFVLREDSRFDSGLAGKTALALAGFAGYGVMVNCMWNCENDTYAAMSLVGVGLVSLASVVVAIAKAND